MSGRTLGIVIAAVGVIVVVVAAFADQVGIGNVDTFGWKQIVGVVAGVVIVVVGVVIAARRGSASEAEADR